MLTRAAAAKLRAMQENATPRRTKTPLASENFVDIFSMLSRWQLDAVGISCRQFRHVVSTAMDTVCLRQFDSVCLDEKAPPLTNPFGQSNIRVDWYFTATAGDPDLSTIFSEVEEAIEDMTKRIASSFVRCIEFRHVDFTDEMLLKVSKTTGPVRAEVLAAVNCDFSSTSEGAVRDLISSFLSIRELSLNRCHLTPAQFTNDLLLDLTRRPELRRARFAVHMPDDSYALHYDLLDAGILALLFREEGEGVEISFGRAWHLGEIVSDEFSKRLLETYQHAYTAANDIRLTVACDIEQQMSRLGDFQQFRRTVDRGGDHLAKTIYELPAKGQGKACLAFTGASGFCPRLLRFDSGDFADHCFE